VYVVFAFDYCIVFFVVAKWMEHQFVDLLDTFNFFFLIWVSFDSILHVISFRADLHDM